MEGKFKYKSDELVKQFNVFTLSMDVITGHPYMYVIKHAMLFYICNKF